MLKHAIFIPFKTIPEKSSVVNDEADKAVSVEDQEGEEEEEETHAHSEVLRRRLRVLTAVCRDLLLDEDILACNEDHVKKFLKDSQQPGVECCLDLINCLKPYIPGIDVHNLLAKVLPFCLLANDVLGYTRYNKLQRNALAIYYILDRGPDRRVMYNYDSSSLTSNIKANQSKDT